MLEKLKIMGYQYAHHQVCGQAHPNRVMRKAVLRFKKRGTNQIAFNESEILLYTQFYEYESQ